MTYQERTLAQLELRAAKGFVIQAEKAIPLDQMEPAVKAHLERKRAVVAELGKKLGRG